MLFESEHPAFVKPGKLNLVQSMLPVPAKYSLIIKADLFDNISNVNILSGTCEFPVPRDGNSSYDSIVGSDCSIKLKVDRKLPFDEPKIPSSPLSCFSNASISRLSIHKTLTDVIDKWAPKLSVKKANIYLLSWNIAEEMHIGYSRSTFIGETLAPILEYSGVVVLRKRFHDWDHPEIEGKSFLDPYISKTRDSYKEKGLTIVSEGDETVIIEGRKLPLVDLTALWHALNVEKADWILHVTDVGQRDYIEMCITAAKHAGWIGNDHSKFPLSHVGFGLVQGDDFERFQNFSIKVVDLANLLDKTKSRSRVLLARQAWLMSGLLKSLRMLLKLLDMVLLRKKTVKEKSKSEKQKLSDDDLRKAICEILKEVDFNTATFTDILKQLAKRFDTDLASRKASIKLMIQEELTKLADEADEEDEEEPAKTEKKASGVKA